MGSFEYWVSLSYYSGNGMTRVESGLLVVDKEIKTKSDIRLLEEQGKIVTGEKVRILSFVLLESEGEKNETDA